MASNIRRPFNKYGAPVGMGQQRAGSAFLDNPDAPEEELEPYEKLPYNANEVNEQRDQPQAHTYKVPAAPVSTPRLNPALDSAIQGSPRATNSNGEAQRTGGVQGPQSGISSLYGGSAQGPTSAPDKAKGMSFDAHGPGGPSDPWQRTANNPQGISLSYDPQRDGPLSDYGQVTERAATSVTGPGMQPAEGGAAARYGTADIPGAETVQWGDRSMPGFNTGGWGTQERGVNTIKNTFGKIASRYDPRTPNATQQILNDPDFQKYFPEATLVPHPKGDQIDFGDGVGVDVLINAVEGGSGEEWAFQVPGMGTAQGGGMMSDPAFAGLFAQGPDASDAYALDSLMPDDQSYSEQLRKIIASGQLEGLDQAILGNQQQPQDDPNDPLAALRRQSPRQRSL